MNWHFDSYKHRQSLQVGLKHIQCVNIQNIIQSWITGWFPVSHLWICFAFTSVNEWTSLWRSLTDQINEKGTELDYWQRGRSTVNILSLSVRWGQLQRAVAAVWARVLPIWGRNAHGALISNRSSPPLLLMACGSFLLLLLLLLCTQSIDWRCWPAPTARCRGREVIGVVCGCVAVCLHQIPPERLYMQ